MEEGRTTLRPLEDIQLAVKYGVQILDERYPAWEQAINLESLAMEDSSRCILGQLSTEPMFGYSHLLVSLGLEDAPDLFGLEAAYYDGHDEYYGLRQEDYRLLKELWTKEIQERRQP